MARFLSQKKMRKHVAAQTLTVKELEQVVVTVLNFNIIERLFAVVVGPRALLRWKGQDDPLEERPR